MPSCTAAGGYRAPKSRTSLNEYHWFCLEHVRAYNASWDFYKGMTPSQIEAQTRSDTGWQRPTWPLGSLGKQQAMDEAMARDPFNILLGSVRPAGADAYAGLGLAGVAGHRKGSVQGAR